MSKCVALSCQLHTATDAHVNPHTHKQTIFQSCGTIVSSELASPQSSSNVVVRLTFKRPADAQSAVTKFDGQPADGRILRVRVVGAQAVSLPGRIAGVEEIVNGEGSVDVLMQENEGGSSVPFLSVIYQAFISVQQNAL